MMDGPKQTHSHLSSHRNDFSCDDGIVLDEKCSYDKYPCLGNIAAFDCTKFEEKQDFKSNNQGLNGINHNTVDLNLSMNEFDPIFDEIECEYELKNESLLMRKEGLLICQWNVDGFTVNARSHIHYIILTKKPDIFLLQEPYKFYDDDESEWTVKIKNYTTVITKKKGFGKIVTLIRNGIHYERINLNFKHNAQIDKRIENLDISTEDGRDRKKKLLMSKIYILTLKVYNNDMGQAFIINNYYRPQNGAPGSNIELLINYLELLSKTKNYATFPIFVGGDMNAHNNAWFDGYIRPSKAKKHGLVLADWIYENKWIILNDKHATRQRKTQRTSPDVSFINDKLKEDDWEFWAEDFTRDDPEKYYSDHLALFSFYKKGDLYEKPAPEFTIRTGSDRDWDQWKKQLSENVEEWHDIYGKDINKLINCYLETYGNGNCDINRDYLLDFVGLSTNDILDAVSDFFKHRIVDTSIDILGLRKNTIGNDKPWMTKEMKYAIKDYICYKERFRSFSKRKKKIMKEVLIEKKKISDDLCDSGRKSWIKDEIRNISNNGRMPWSQINNIIKYDNNTSRSIPVWYNKDGTTNAVKSINKAKNYMSYLHRYDDDEIENESDENDTNEAFERIINDYNAKNKANFGTDAHIAELKELNSILDIGDVEPLIMSFKKGKASNSDRSNYVLLQNGIEILRQGLYLCYNALFILGIREKSMNIRDITVILKSNKPAKYMDSYRPVSLLSSCSNPYDKWMATKYLKYAIKMRIIKPRHFGFVKGLGCTDTIAYLTEIIWNNRINNKNTHVLFIDFKAAFDTLQHKIIIECMRINIGINGFALDYLYVALEYRWGRVKIYGFYCKWRQDICGVPQGWPPSPIIFIFITIEFDAINGLKIGILIIAYADDNTMASDGSVSGDELRKNLQFAVDYVSYLAKKKRLFLQPIKQNYMVIAVIVNNAIHKQLYFELKMGDQPITKIFNKVRYLGVWIDWNLNWNAQFQSVIVNGRRSFLNIFKRYKYASDLIARQLVNIYKALIYPKLLYAAEIWYDSKHGLAAKLRSLFNDTIRHSNYSEKTNPVNWQLVQIGETGFDYLVASRKSSFWSRIIRSPKTNILSEIIEKKYWKMWNDERLDLNDQFKQKQTKKLDHKIDTFDANKIEISNKMYRNDLSDDWEFVNNEEEGEEYKNKKTMKKNRFRKKFEKRYHLFFELFDAAANIKNSDVKFMKNVSYEVVPKRLSYHLKRLISPKNLLCYLRNEKDEKMSFDKEWVKEWSDNLFYYDSNPLDLKQANKKKIQLLFSDGSNKDGYGGAGYWSCNLDYYLKTADLEALRIRNYKQLKGPYDNGLSNYYYGASSTGLRSSIDHCELDAAEKGLGALYRYCFDIYERDPDLVPDDVCVIIDNETVVNWIAGCYEIKNVIIYEKIKVIHRLIMDLEDYGMDVHLIWVKAHNNEIGNEIADDMAKAGMFDIYRTMEWNEIEKRFTNHEWDNYSYTAIKKENKRKGFYSTLNDWEKHKDLRKKKVKNEEQILSKNLIDWNIRYIDAYKFEMKALRRKQWKFVAQLRSGHTALNGQRKYGSKTRNCDHCKMEKQVEIVEDIYHFICICDKYTDQRLVLKAEIIAIDEMYQQVSNEELLFKLLFPYQEELMDTNINRDPVKKRIFLHLRIEILEAVCKYVTGTKKYITDKE